MLRLLTLVCCSLAIAAPPKRSVSQNNHRCLISIQYETIHGETSFEEIVLKATSQAECLRKGEIHKTNFEPELVKKKTVTIKWEEIP